MANDFRYSVALDRDNTPTLTILTTSASYRLLRSAMHQAASWLEEASEGERWCVCGLASSDTRAVVIIELATGQDSERARADAMLRRFLAAVTGGAS